MEDVRRPAGRLRRVLGFWGAASLSIGVLAPTLAMSLTGVEPARAIGRAAPLAYVFAALGVGFVCYGFSRLASRFASAGSVYAFASHTLGRRVGFCTGWAFLGTYLVFPPVSIAGIALFARAFLGNTGVWEDADWFPLAFAGWLAIALLAFRGIRPTTRTLLVFEAVSCLLILVLVAVIYARLALGDAPHGAGLNGDWLHLPPGTSFSTVALAATFGFLSFAGFEAAGSAGEEANAPTRVIPRAIFAAVGLGAVFYVVCMVAQTLGFGTDAAGVGRFAGSEAPLQDLAGDYVGGWLGDALDLGAILSALGAGLGGVLVGSRLLYAFARDGIGVRRLGAVAERTGTPAPALAVVLLVTLAELVAFRLAGAPIMHVFFYLATPGVLSLLVMYIVTNTGALRLLVLREHRLIELPLLLAGIVIAGYTLYRNVWPVPPHPFNLFPYLVGVWLALGWALTLVLPAFRGSRVAAPVADPG